MIEIKRARPAMCSGCLCDPDTVTETKFYDLKIRMFSLTLCDECLKELKERIEEL
jgi:hypothetical protein